MSNREYVIEQINILPDNVIDKIQEFIEYQKFSIGIFDSDDEYLASIPGMTESIKDGLATPLTDCVPITGVWPDV